MRFSSLSILAIAAVVPAMSTNAQDPVILDEIIISSSSRLRAILQMTV
ncbi:hypothetical protein [Paracoccus acridae]|nr:hypothetical protein [Paracoccus acridae]